LGYPEPTLHALLAVRLITTLITGTDSTIAAHTSPFERRWQAGPGLENF